MGEFSMPSNSGHATTSISLVGEAVAGRQVLEVRVVEEFWNRSLEKIENPMVPDFEIVLHQVVSSRAKLDLLLAALDGWLADRTPIDLDLCVIKHQSLRLTVAPEPGWISSRDKPVFRCRYVTDDSLKSDRDIHVPTGSPGFNWAYVIDPTCPQPMREDLEDALRPN